MVKNFLACYCILSLSLYFSIYLVKQYFYNTANGSWRAVVCFLTPVKHSCPFNNVSYVILWKITLQQLLPSVSEVLSKM